MLRLFGLPVLAATLFIGGYCPPPGERVVVFVQGIYTTLDDGKTQVNTLGEPRFATLKQAFRDAGFPEERLLDFSYNGGSVTDGAWLPDDYACADTDRPIDESVDRLDAMLRAYREEHPRAGFVVVGHSLGGYVAFELAQREASRRDKAGVSAVVTIDAPLLGVHADKEAVMEIVGCEGRTYAAGADLVRLASDPALQGVQSVAIAAIRDDGIRVATLGSSSDCLYFPSMCGLPGEFTDDRATQTLDGADLLRYEAVPGNPIESHDAPTAYGPFVAAIVEFAGPP